MKWSRSSLFLIGLLSCSLQASEQADPQWQLAEAAYALGDHAQAARLWRELAEAGHSDAQLYLGFLHKIGRGVEASRAESLHWYRLAAEQGDPHAQYQLGLIFELGEGVKADYDEAEYWYGLATSQDFCPGELSAGGALGDD